MESDVKPKKMKPIILGAGALLLLFVILYQAGFFTSPIQLDSTLESQKYIR